MPGDLLRSSFGCCALATVVLFAGPPHAAADQDAAEGAFAPTVSQSVVELRRLTACPAAPTDDQGREIEFRGHPSIEIKGRARGGETAGTLLDFAIYGPAVGRVVSYTCFANASTRQSGEAIISLAEASNRGDKLARAIVHGANLELESIRRYRTARGESIYYEARYASTAGEFPFFEPPVRLLLNASTGSFFRLDIDPDWLGPAAPPQLRISRKAAERIATVVLRGSDLAPEFGSGAVLGRVAGAEMFTVHPNDWLGFFTESAGARARVAWVVPFRIDGGESPGLQNLFVDAGTGRILGGVSILSAWQLPR